MMQDLSDGKIKDSNHYDQVKRYVLLIHLLINLQLMFQRRSYQH